MGTDAPHRTVRPLAVLLALLLAALLLPAVDGTAQAAGDGLITGVVTGPAGEPAAFVSVAARVPVGAGGSEVRNATTGRDGRYALELPAGTYQLQVADFEGMYATRYVPSVPVRAGATTTRDVRLEEASVLVGRVSRADGGSVAYVQVVASTPGTWEPWDVRTGEVGEDGSFRVAGLGAGTWSVRLRPFDATGGVYLPQDLAGRVVLDESAPAGTPVRVGRAATVDLGSHVLRHRTPVLRGRVLRRDGRALRRAIVRLDVRVDEGEERPPGQLDVTGARGRWALQLPTPGERVRIRISAPGRVSKTRTVTVPGVGETVRVRDVRLRRVPRP